MWSLKLNQWCFNACQKVIKKDGCLRVMAKLLKDLEIRSEDCGVLFAHHWHLAFRDKKERKPGSVQLVKTAEQTSRESFPGGVECWRCYKSRDKVRREEEKSSKQKKSSEEQEPPIAFPNRFDDERGKDERTFQEYRYREVGEAHAQ